MIDQSHVRDLLAMPDDDAALVLMEGRAHVVDPPRLASEAYRGAAVLLTRGDLVGRLGTASPQDHQVRELAATLRTMAGELGA
ncbi:hypothetical protein QWM81_07845 [Streptomyces ficellus]|uniref:Uncharacterized protein n=1 Tax=Streptomyces ficellus TaxID=1977088 RepID=A0ABT7Z3A9_9ACTN|nr:hypothetical protein [Streptomyces ficellus]MDN3293959.1 hypothetical protein [Streptomyces ficellus]